MLIVLALIVSTFVLFWLARLDARVETIEAALIDCANELDADPSNLTRGG